ncbi:aminoglycoside N(3)-acetyltransferase [Salsuginibacillus kocurii]|uniref:aminoglycoside N(3)-acetyltransferase n=1 Tax=Salsuginibacillus kocurii TaxID=427078 RepID=UPI00035CBBCE|nr:AAC(3) family N-acetyltransferase [Salsuginibacillus kocurii]
MKKLVQQTPSPRTVDTLTKDFHEVGIEAGMTVIMHSSLSSIGWVNGGSIAVIQALQTALTEKGTLVMPAHSADWSDPAEWGDPAIPRKWWDTVRETMPVFDPAVTPTRGMGKIAEAFRTYPGVVRSDHPVVSFAAWGRDKEAVIETHSLDFGLGKESPLQYLYEMNASVLLLGVGYDSNTSFHLGEYYAPNPTFMKQGAPIEQHGKRVWETYQDIETKEEQFAELGADFEKEHEVPTGYIGSAKSKLFSVREAADYSSEWIKKDRMKK